MTLIEQALMVHIRSTEGVNRDNMESKTDRFWDSANQAHALLDDGEIPTDPEVIRSVLKRLLPR